MHLNQALPCQTFLQRITRILAFVLMLGFAQNINAQLHVGPDLPFKWYEDTSATLGLAEFLNLPDSSLTPSNTIKSLGYTRSALWLSSFLPASAYQNQSGWISLGPNFVNHIAIYLRPKGTNLPWIRKDAGDTWPGPRGDIDYRYAIFALPELPPGSPGFELIVRAESDSALLVRATLWPYDRLLEQSAKSTGFWSFYFGLAVISFGLALLLAITINKRLLWSICLFCLTYVLVACIEGFVWWLTGSIFPNLQHYLTSLLNLLAFSSLLWMWAEALDLRRCAPRLYKVILFDAVLIAGLIVLIPLNQYGLAVKIQIPLFALAAVCFVISMPILWLQKKISGLVLLLGLSPVAYFAAGILAQLSLYGLVPYYDAIYIVWQYALMMNILLVLGLAVQRVRAENRQNRDKQVLARELRIEREASFHQRQFIGVVSHEFRTPLAIISSALQNLRLGPLSDTQRNERYDKIQRATDRLTQLTDNCLADSRLSAASLYLDSQPADIILILKSALELVDTAQGYDVKLTLNDSPSTQWPPRIIANIDAAMLRIALSNLLDNAVKYTEPGLIEVDISTTADAVIISITDNGPGIPEDQASHIFERYRRVEGQGRRSQGTGLGLYVAHEIARAHGGKLVLKHRRPSGCRFEMTLPICSKQTP